MGIYIIKLYAKFSDSVVKYTLKYNPFNDSILTTATGINTGVNAVQWWSGNKFPPRFAAA